MVLSAMTPLASAAVIQRPRAASTAESMQAAFSSPSSNANGAEACPAAIHPMDAAARSPASHGRSASQPRQRGSIASAHESSSASARSARPKPL
ncbi:MAG: hypothetical protein EBR10_09580 [Planctomycetes bacterium]|nr:hypothetical protein [Planctomycetota bacterium]